MTSDQIIEILKDVFGRNVGAKIVGDWVTFPCQLARWTHETGRDSSPSAGISIHPSNVSVFSCFTCGNKAPIQGMLRKWANFTGEDLDDLIEELEEEAYLGARTLPSWDDAKNKGGGAELARLDPAIYLDLYDPAAGHPYLEQRGISDETADMLQLMLDPCDPADGEERILFPVFGVDGALHGFTGRATSSTARLKVRDYHGLAKAHCVLGAHLFGTERRDKVLVVEGLFDYANAWQCGQPAVAVMHSSMTAAQAAILREIGLPTYLFYDNDDAGQKGIREAGEALARYQPTMRVRYPEVWIENEEEDEGGHWLKDPGELLEEEFAGMIEDARLY